ncbi:HPr(Ser) kinase/phosphatase [bacterium]|nr:HPr(Ser) kinase/phosphatase [bacterium]
MSKTLKVEDFLKRFQERFQLNVFTGPETLGGELNNSEVSRPGLVLAGFTRRFAFHRTMVLGETEIVYLEELPQDRLREILDLMFGFQVPMIIISKGLEPPAYMVEAANNRGVPVLGSGLGTQELIRKLANALEVFFAAQTWVHGSLADVFGVGLLYIGPSGIGKSECVLDLVERGHRLVCDDLVHVVRVGENSLVGMLGNEKLGHHMEIRGLGIIDVFRLFGIRSVRARKRIEVVVQLSMWDEKEEYDRTGLNESKTEILDVELPLIKLPLVPGKNITVISEVIAMNYLLKLKGHNVAEEFNRRLLEQMRQDYYIDELSE